jgi:hypothetical protein
MGMPWVILSFEPNLTNILVIGVVLVAVFDVFVVLGEKNGAKPRIT